MIYKYLKAAMARLRSTKVADPKTEIKIPDGWGTCNTCHGEGYLFYLWEQFPNDPPARSVCNACGGNGIIPNDNRSDKLTE